ncbi:MULTISPECIES: hypothetical protein [unclassified Sinorhizobium]
MALDIRIAYPGRLGIPQPLLVSYRGDFCVLYNGLYVIFRGPSAEQVTVP